MTINFFGDFLAPSVNELQLSDDISEIISSADYNVVNFEAPINSMFSVNRFPKSGPSHSQDAAGPAWLESHGFNLISLANNHIMDYGEDALKTTMSAFTGAKTFGAGTWSEAYAPRIFEKDGISVAILGLAHCEFGMLADRWDGRYQTGIAWINHPDVDRIIVETKKHVDFLIVFAHAGIEHIEQPLPEWRDRYRSFVDLGCDAIIASHPHIIQGYETYRDKPIVYSLGNFFFPKSVEKPKRWYRSLCASLDLNGSRVSLRIIPCVFSNLCIELDNSSESLEYLDRVNRVLNDDKVYMEYINHVCLEKLHSYKRQFGKSGYIFIAPKFLLKQFVGYLLKRDFNSTHLMNVLRCESHRWCISRGIKLRDNYQ